MNRPHHGFYGTTDVAEIQIGTFLEILDVPPFAEQEPCVILFLLVLSWWHSCSTRFLYFVQHFIHFRAIVAPTASVIIIADDNKNIDEVKHFRR